MAKRYLLPCACGGKVCVESGQAGDTVRCPCGATLDVPPMRQLRQLEPAAPVNDQVRSAWAPRQGLALAGLAIVVLALAVAVYLWRIQPPSPATYARTGIEQLDRAMHDITPQQSWALWQDQMLGEGLVQFQSPGWVAYRQELRRSRHRIKVALAVAAVGLLIALAALLFSPQQPAP